MNAARPRQLVGDVAALYVDPTGPYPELVEHWYDEVRDATTYAGPFPVVAHPPCGPWGRLRFLCTKQAAEHGPHGVAMARRWGGVLEHPAESMLFRHCRMPWPGELPDQWGGRTYSVRQVAWGHACEKPTWLYVVRVDARQVVAGLRTGGRATHRITSGPRGPQLPSAHAKLRRLTPRPFAEWLVAIAQLSAAAGTFGGGSHARETDQRRLREELTASMSAAAGEKNDTNRKGNAR